MKQISMKLGILMLFLFLLPALAHSQTTTPNLGMTIPATGQTNWQVPMNTNLSTLDTALGGISNLPTGATPTITVTPNWLTGNSSSTTITNFIGGFPGQSIRIFCGASDTFTTIATGANISLATSWSCSSSKSIVLVLVGSVWTETARQGGNGGVPTTTVSGLTAYRTKGQLAVVTDGSTATDCVTGGGSNVVACQYSGSAWSAVSASGASGVSSLSNSDGTLTVSPTTGAVVASLNLAHANTFTATQTFPSASITNAELATPPLTLASVSHEWLTSYTSSTGAFTQSQPNFTDLAGSLALGQMPAIFQTNSANNFTATLLNMETSTTNAVGLTVTPTNSSGAIEKFEITGTASETANEFLATPNGSSGALGLRVIVSADLPATIAANTTGNAASATALATTPSQCSGSQFATGIAANGNANCGTPTGGGNTTSSTMTTGYIPQATGANSIGNSSPVLDNGVTATNTLTYGGSGGITASAGPISAASDGVHAGHLGLVGNTTVPNLASNTFNLIGPSAASFTAWGMQAPATVPTTLDGFHCVTSGEICTLTDNGYAYNAIPNADVSGLGTLATIATGTLTNGDFCTYSSTGPTISCNSTSGGGNVSTTGTTTAGYFPKFGSPTTGITNGHLDDGVTNSGYITSTEPTWVHLATNENLLVQNLGGQAELAAENDANSATENLTITGTLLTLNSEVYVGNGVRLGNSLTDEGYGTVNTIPVSSGGGYYINNALAATLVNGANCTLGSTTGCNANYTTGTLTANDLPQIANATGGELSDSGIVAANVMQNSATVTTQGETPFSTTTAGTYTNGDFYGEPDKFESANCNNATAGAGWSLPASSAPTATCRTGTNVWAGYLQFAASESAQFQDEIPDDWDSSTNPYVRINYTQAGSTSSQTIAYQIQTGCSTTTDDPSFATAQAFSTTTTGATANTPYTQTLQLNSTSMTSCSAGNIMNVKISTTSSSNGSSNAQFVSITWPHKNPGKAQAN